MKKNISSKFWKHGCTMRINKLRDQYLAFQPSIDIERALSYTTSYKETMPEPTVYRRAKALQRVVEEKTIKILPHELIVGNRGAMPRAAEVNPEIDWRWLNDELDTVSTRPQDPYLITKKQKKLLLEEVFPYWKGKSMEEYYDAIIEDSLRNIVYDSGIVFGRPSKCGPGTFSANYGDSILKIGFKGIKEKAEALLESLDPAEIKNIHKKQFLEAVIITCNTMKILGSRHAGVARKTAKYEKNHLRVKELLNIAKICDRVPYEPPRTFHEAIQAVWFTQLMLYTEENSDSYCMGRLDQYLYPFYEQDRDEGRINDLEVQELLECLWIKSAEIIWTLDQDSARYNSGYIPFHGVTCGGVAPSGRDATNELSYMMLRATMDTRLHCPSLSVRIHPQSPDEFLMKVCDLIALGTGMPSVHNDQTAIAILLSKGIKLEDARNWAVVGCVEPQVPGKMSQSDESGRYSLASAVELALSNGNSRILEKKIGITTGNPNKFQTYEEFEGAVKNQLSYIIRQTCMNSQRIEIAQNTILPKPLISCCATGCVESATEISQGGAIYNCGPGVQATGLADLADSMMVVKNIVFEEKKLSMSELCNVVDKNFEGYENTRQMFVNTVPKFGNDNDEVDQIAHEFADFACNEVEKYTGMLGNSFCNGLVTVSANVSHGSMCWALPSGKKARESLADGCGPYMGRDLKGPTAVIKSVSKLSHAKHTDGILLNMRFSPNVVKGTKGRNNLAAFIKTVMDLGIYHIQFNVVDTETLINAQKTPEKYGELMVRVAGYSARFVDLHKDVQDSIIGRTEHASV